MKVLITDLVHELLLDGLEAMGMHVTYRPELPAGRFVQECRGYQGVVINSKIKMPEEIQAQLPDLRFIARLGSGLEIIDLDAAASHEIAVFSAPEGNCQAVAEHALGMLLSLFNRLSSADRNVRSMDWDREGHRGLELYGRTVGLVGFGHTGQAFAKILRGFNCEILVYDIDQKDMSQFHWCTWSTIEEIQAKATVVSLHVSYNPDSMHLVCADWINSFSQPFYLLNTSRGMVVKTEDLIQAIDHGKVLGACLDVFENEKPATFSADEKARYAQLYTRSEVVLSPHVAGWTSESKEKISAVLLRKITDWWHSQ